LACLIDQQQHSLCKISCSRQLQQVC
jgi:hypothetical protein